MQALSARPLLAFGRAARGRKSLKKGLLRMAVVWTLVVVISAIWAVNSRIDDHRALLIQSGQHRLDSLGDSLDITFQQLEALPRALSRQMAVHSFLQRTRVPDSADLSPADQARTKAWLLRRDNVRDMARVLRDTAKDFAVSDLFVLDRFGTSLADSLIAYPHNSLGGNVRTRRYFTDALESGTGSQFAVDRFTKVPSFFFVARVESDQQLLGMIGIKQEARAFRRFFDDAEHQLMVTDRQGVILMSSQDQNLLKHTPLLGPLSDDEAHLKQMAYGQAPTELAWRVTPVQVHGRALTQAVINDRPYLVLRRPVNYGGLIAWALVPLQGEQSFVIGGVLAATLALVLGYWFLAATAQRARRLNEATQARQDLYDMAHALPLVVFRYYKPAGGPGYFTFVGQGLKKVLGVEASALRLDPDLAWRLAGLPPQQNPPLESIEFQLTVDGQQRWMCWDSMASPQADGSITYNGYWLDITERKLSQDRANAVFRYTPNAFLFSDENLVIYRANPGALRLFRAEREQALLGLKLACPPLSPKLQANGRSTEEELADITAEVQRNPSLAQTFEWRHSRLDGEEFEAEVVMIPFLQDGRPHHCAVITDITARKLTEAALREARAAAEASATAKANFLANMSHEIRTPMNAVLGMTHLALLEDLTPAARNYVDKANRAAGNLLQIINDVLDVSKIESGKLGLENVAFQLDEVVGNIADVLGVPAQEKGLELLFSAPPDLPSALVGDPGRLGQVLINLGNNAIKFTERGGDVVIGADVQHQDAEGVELHFWIKDTGIGMAPEVIAHLFEPFTQGDSSTTRQFGGTGLGLTISRQLVDLMGGRIWVDSAPARGSTFHFTAHFGVPQTEAPPRAAASSELEGQRVLLVDDNASAREILGNMMRRLGLEVDVAESGEDALRLLREAQQHGRMHHLLVTDWKMPGMDGIAFARQALNAPAQQRPCVLLVSAFGRDEALQAAEGLPLASILTKPVTPRSLRDSIARALNQQVEQPQVPATTEHMFKLAQRQLGGARLLLVEDQPLNQELACDLLQRAGIDVVTAANGREALDQLRLHGPFDGVLMDCQMPVMDGYAATERIRANPAWAHLPVIAMTASAMASDRERVLRSGMNDHIIKPLDLGQMFGTMARWIVPQHGLSARAETPAPTARPAAAASPAPPDSPLLDTQDGLSRCMGNEALYQRLLKGFAETYQDFDAQFSQARQAENRRDATRLAHSLRGMAGSIGARQLEQAAQTLETACREEQPDDAVNAALQGTGRALRAVLEHIGERHTACQNGGANSG